MMLNAAETASRIERFVRETFEIPETDERFNRTCDLFDEGFVDSFGLIQLITFLEEEFGILIDEEHLFDERFVSIEGESRLVVELVEAKRHNPSAAGAVFEPGE